MALRFAMILEAIDRATGPARRVLASIGRLVGGVRRWGQNMRRLARDVLGGSRSLSDLARRARQLASGGLGRMFQAGIRGARRFIRGIDQAIRRLDLLRRAGRAASAGLGWLGGKAMGALKWGAAGAGALASFSIFDMLRTGGQFEQYQMMLEGTEGSAEGARKAMAWIQKFAKDTPYELDQVMEAFIQLKAYGLDPLNGSLMTLGDASAGMNKQIGDAVEALADAVTGEYERLKGFGIRASVAGDKVTFSFRKDGKDILRTVKATGAEIEKAVTGILKERFGGAMGRLSGTLFGILANLKDLWNGFLLMVSNAGIFDRVKAGLEELRARIDAMAGDGRLQEWAQKISDYLSKAWDWANKFVRETDWAQVGRDIKTIAEALLIAANAIKDIANAGPKVRTTVDALSGPAGMYRIGQRAYDAYTASRPKVAPPRPQSQRDRDWQKANPARSWITRPPAAPTAGTWTRLPKAGTKVSAAQPAQVGGSLDINVKVEGAASARVARVATVNRAVPIRARVGKIMGEPA